MTQVCSIRALLTAAAARLHVSAAEEIGIIGYYYKGVCRSQDGMALEGNSNGNSGQVRWARREWVVGWLVG